MSITRIALPLLGRGGWTGGLVYLRNTLQLIRTRLAGELEAHVFLSAAERERFGDELAPLVDGRLIVGPETEAPGRGASLARALATGSDAPLARRLLEAGIDVALESASFYGARFPLPVISWMPDFQHRHMPEMFGRGNRLRRDLGFRMQVRAPRTLMLSSESARADLERFYPGARGRAHVVPFALDVDIAAPLAAGAAARAAHALPERFLFLPNQFWRHKNHAVIVAALARLESAGELDAVPPVILTGQPRDPRHPAHFETLMARVAEAGVGSHFRHLGLIPYADVMALNAACTALINPSRFEGWSTPIEEAKTFATPLLLADIPIHREQAPDARFFDWRSAEACAEALLDVARRAPTARPPLAALERARDARLDAHAAALLATVRAATTASEAA